MYVRNLCNLLMVCACVCEQLYVVALIVVINAVAYCINEAILCIVVVHLQPVIKKVIA